MSLININHVNKTIYLFKRINKQRMDRSGLSGEEGSEAADREGVVSPTSYV